MTTIIEKLIKSQGLLICPSCDGEGEYETFCGHYTTESCIWCAGRGIVKSLNKQKHRKPCVICQGKGCLGGCNHCGYHEWETYELYEGHN